MFISLKYRSIISPNQLAEIILARTQKNGTECMLKRQDSNLPITYSLRMVDINSSLFTVSMSSLLQIMAHIIEFTLKFL